MLVEALQTTSPEVISPEEMIEREATFLLREALAKVKRGWCQLTPVLVDDNNVAVAYCSTGALMASYELLLDGDGKAIASVASRDRAYERLADKIFRSWPHDRRGSYDYSGQIIVWNDFSGRTQEQVVAAFEEAIG